MNEFEDGMFKYLTEPTNYKSADELSSLLVSINERLFQEFWDNVSRKLQEKLKSQELLVEYIRDGNSYIFEIKKSNWVDIAIGFDEELDLGLIMRDKRNKFFENDLDRISVKHKDILPQIQKENDNWLCYQEIDNANFYRFGSFKELFQILPDNRDKFINQIADYLISFTKKVVIICDEINELKRK